MDSSSGVDPEILAARARQAATATPADPTRMPVAEARRAADAAAASFNDGGPSVGEVRTFEIAGPAGPMRARLYRPDGATGAILFLHGGGWYSCSVDTHDRAMRCLALESGLAVVGIDYRLTPEHPYPAALDDSLAAWRWLTGAAEGLSLDPARLAVAGDSAGANLALALSITQRDAGEPVPAAGALVYGMFAPLLDTPSQQRNGDGRYGLTTERTAWYWRQYIGECLDAPPGLAAPLNADLRGLGPQYVALAEFDALADESRMLAARLAEAGVEHALDEWPGAVHGFLQMTRDVALARQAVATAGRALARWLA